MHQLKGLNSPPLPTPPNARWTCGNCRNLYSLPEIESRLVRIVSNMERCYQLQDLKCTRCKQVRMRRATQALAVGGDGSSRTLGGAGGVGQSDHAWTLVMCGCIGDAGCMLIAAGLYQ